MGGPAGRAGGAGRARRHAIIGAVPNEVEPRPTSKGERTRERIVEHAVVRFGSSGFRATSLAAVARDVGITAAAIYPYFKTKEELFVAAAEADLDRLLAEAEGASVGSPTPWITFLQSLVATLDRHPFAVRVLTEGPRELTDELLALGPLRRIGERLRGDLAAGQALGLVRGDVDAGMLASAFETVALALLTAMHTNGLGTQPERRAALAAMFLAATLPPAGTPVGDVAAT